ncbi:hypothetical protein FQZ97_1032990 [compost metagenome]
MLAAVGHQHAFVDQLLEQALIAALGAHPFGASLGALEHEEFAVDLLTLGADAVARHLQGETRRTADWCSCA